MPVSKRSTTSTGRRASSSKSTTSRAAGKTSAKRTASTPSRTKPAGRTETTRSRAKSKTTTDHEEIRRWAEARGAHPSVAKNTRGKNGGSIGVIRLDFPGFSGEGSLEPITWEQFFETFDKQQLALVYQEKTAGNKPSNFNKLVRREA